MKCVGVKLGDWIYVIGILGDSVVGLVVLQNCLMVDELFDVDYLLVCYLWLMLCVLQGQVLCDLVILVIDFFDGLIFDLGYIFKVSGCGVCIDFDVMLYFDVMLCQVDFEQVLCWVFVGGEDYELCFIVLELNCGVLDVVFGYFGVCFICIGQIVLESEGLQFICDGKLVVFDLKGYDYFVQLR